MWFDEFVRMAKQTGWRRFGSKTRRGLGGGSATTGTANDTGARSKFQHGEQNRSLQKHNKERRCRAHKEETQGRSASTARSGETHRRRTVVKTSTGSMVAVGVPGTAASANSTGSSDGAIKCGASGSAKMRAARRARGMREETNAAALGDGGHGSEEISGSENRRGRGRKRDGGSHR